MKTITIFDDLENNKEDYQDIINDRSRSNKTTIILLSSYYENKKKNIYSIFSLFEKKKNNFKKKF